MLVPLSASGQSKTNATMQVFNHPGKSSAPKVAPNEEKKRQRSTGAPGRDVVEPPRTP